MELRSEESGASANTIEKEFPVVVFSRARDFFTLSSFRDNPEDFPKQIGARAYLIWFCSFAIKQPELIVPQRLKYVLS